MIWLCRGGAMVYFMSDGEEGNYFHICFWRSFRPKRFLYLLQSFKLLEVGFVQVARTSPLELVEGVGLCTFCRSGFWGKTPAVWSLPFFLPTTCHSPFSVTTQETGKGIARNAGHKMDPTRGFTTPVRIAGKPITGETEITNSVSGIFGLRGPELQKSFSLCRKMRGDQSLHTSSKLVYGRS